MNVLSGGELQRVAIVLALGKPAAKELNEMDLPFPAYMQLFTLVISAATGEKPEVVEQRFQDPAE